MMRTAYTEMLMQNSREHARNIVNQACSDYQITFCAWKAGVLLAPVTNLENLSVAEIVSLEFWMRTQAIARF